ncbi:hypothetical protein CRM22_010458 [Opisthorchis felineus]|uniref:SOCS box domain-containing protein n=1 Tax=Opisthorchis felineus TaxID=147828 RepID=A0A4S2KZT7_OPIFE|nr:hypothetical protein CRM22_010458 [Opisthorchis felineus]TGZ55297.1 hypothetical protein CRM22_010458 [Opisthorchis felineus]
MCALPCNPLMLPSVRILETGTNQELRNLVKEVDLVRVRDADNNTLLHHACLLGNVEAVRLLLDAGLHPNVGNVDGHTALCDAALNGSTEVISLLLNHGVDVNPSSYWGSPLMYATKNGHIDAMRLLIKAGAAVNAPDRSGLCPLHVAIQKRFYAGAHLLLMGDADPNCPARLTTPLHLAAEMNDLHGASLLLAHGAHPNPIDKFNRTPLDYVPRDTELYRLLNAMTSQVPSLQFLVRLAFRKTIQAVGPEQLSKLRLPSFLYDYLTFNRL